MQDTLFLGVSCSYACNTATGEVYHVELDEKYIVAPCPKCGLHIMANADIRGVKEPKIGCPICDVIFDYPAVPDGNLKTTELLSTEDRDKSSTRPGVF